MVWLKASDPEELLHCGDFPYRRDNSEMVLRFGEKYHRDHGRLYPSFCSRSAWLLPDRIGEQMQVKSALQKT